MHQAENFTSVDCGEWDVILNLADTHTVYTPLVF